MFSFYFESEKYLSSNPRNLRAMASRKHKQALQYAGPAPDLKQLGVQSQARPGHATHLDVPKREPWSPPSKASRMPQYLPQAKLGSNFIHHLGFRVFQKLQAVLCANLLGQERKKTQRSPEPPHSNSGTALPLAKKESDASRKRLTSG